MNDFITTYKSLLKKDAKWQCIKIPFSLFWAATVLNVLFSIKAVPFPLSICTFVDCHVLLYIISKTILSLTVTTAVVFYLLEKYSFIALSVMLFVSILVFAMEDSQGIFNRNDILSAIILAQWLAYLSYKINTSVQKLAKNRWQFSLQAIAACYTLAAISKLNKVGIDWVFATDGLAIQSTKGILFRYVNTGNEFHLSKANFMGDFILSHSSIFTLFLAGALALEFFAVVMLISKKWRIAYGVFLLLMHLGIYLTMNIIITPFIVAILLFLINIVYLGFNIFYVKK